MLEGRRPSRFAGSREAYEAREGVSFGLFH
jgi:hypothetical protein